MMDPQHDPMTTIAAVALGLGQFLTWFANRRTGKHRDRARSAHEARVENGIRAVQTDVGALRDETRASTAALERRVDFAFTMLTGSPDGDGRNGHRSKINDLEERTRELERVNPQRPADVGNYTSRRG